MGVVLKQGIDLLALALVTRKMRQADQDEIYNLGWDEDPDALAARTAAGGPFQWIAWKDGVPIASIGAHANRPHVWTCWAFGTDRWNEVVFSLTKHVVRHMIPALTETGVHRVQCHASAEHTRAREWLMRMGAKQSDPLDFYGKNGQTYFCYWWDRQSVESNLRLARHLPANNVSQRQT